MTEPNPRIAERLVDELRGWPGVDAGEHRFGGTEFHVGDREIGHLHAWGGLDVEYSRSLRDVLVRTGLTDPHHLLPDSGWTTFYLRTAGDYEQARWLLRLSYLHHVEALRERADGPGPDVGVDVAAELDALDPSASIRTAFERRPATA